MAFDLAQRTTRRHYLSHLVSFYQAQGVDCYLSSEGMRIRVGDKLITLGAEVTIEDGVTPGQTDGPAEP